MIHYLLNRRHIWIYILILTISYSCKSTQRTHQSEDPNRLDLSTDELFLADSIIQLGLDREALYTLLSDIKPMSSLAIFSYPIATQDSVLKLSGDVVNKKDQDLYLTKLQDLQNTLNKLELPDLEFVLVPYRHVRGKDLLIQLSVIRRSSLDKLLAYKKGFFGQFGLVPGADAHVVVSTIENAGAYQRFRGYGFLFGYPDYAVDFFVTAAARSGDSDQVQPRNFFQIPTFKGAQGYFVYAYPKDHQPTADVDSVIYNKATRVLEEYKALRQDYVKKDSLLNAYQLLKDTRTIR